MTYESTNMIADRYAIIIFYTTANVRNFHMYLYVMVHEKIRTTKAGQNSEEYV